MKKLFKKIISSILLLSILFTFIVPGTFVAAEENPLPSLPPDEDGSNLWLRYVRVSDADKLDEYRRVVTNIVVPNPSSSATLTIIRDELNMGLDGLLDLDIPYVETDTISEGSVIVGTPASSSIIRSLNLEDTLDSLGDEGYIIKSVTIDGKKVTVIASKGEFGALYGTFGFLRLLQTQKSINQPGHLRQT